MSGEIGAAEDRLVTQWIRPVLGDAAQVGFDDAAPVAAGEALRVSFRLLDVLPSPPPRGHTVPPLRLQARYAVTVTGGKAGEARAALADLAFAALGAGALELERDAPPPEGWGALASTPRAALVVRVPLTRLPAQPKVPLVRTPLEPRWAGLRPLDGMVVTGPDNTGVAGALIELDVPGLATYSDHRGAFHFPAVPDEPATRTIVVQAKGRRLAFQAARGAGPVILTLPLPEP